MTFAVPVSSGRVLAEGLLASPCLQGTRHELLAIVGARSAAECLSRAIEQANSPWVVFVHQDVYLPEGWDDAFESGVCNALALWPQTGLVGVYGIARAAPARLGNVLDRGERLREPEPLPALAGTLDELLFAVPRRTPLRPDPRLGFHLYAADLALQAEQKGLATVVVDAYCEHRSALPRSGFAPELVNAFAASCRVFEEKWRDRLPVWTPSMDFPAGRDTATWILETYLP